jgi:hypothetical protein
LFLKFAGSQSKSISSFFRSSKSKTVCVHRALVCLFRTTSTRGGKEIKPHNTSILLRRSEHHLDEHSLSTSTDKPGLPIPSDEHADALELDLTFDLQSEVEMNLFSGTQAAMPVKHLTPSFRTPNIQHEVNPLTATRTHISTQISRM